MPITKKLSIMQNNANLQTTFVEQTANELLGSKAKKLWFLVIETPVGKYTMNVGEKSYEEVKRLTAPRETSTVIQVLDKEKGTLGIKLP